MSELKAFNSERIYWAVEQVEREAGDIDSLHLDDSQFYLKSEADKVIARHKYKRCLAMAQEWRNYAAFCGMQSSCHNHRGFGNTAEKYSWKETHAWKCVKRWIAIAEKFKEAK